MSFVSGPRAMSTSPEPVTLKVTVARIPGPVTVVATLFDVSDNVPVPGVPATKLVSSMRVALVVYVATTITPNSGAFVSVMSPVL